MCTAELGAAELGVGQCENCTLALPRQWAVR